MRRLPEKIESALSEVDASRWSVVMGHGHRKILIDGRVAGVVPVNPGGNRRAELNVVAQIRRHLKAAS